MRRTCLLSAVFFLSVAASVAAGERLYNGIELPERWPPRLKLSGAKVMPVPYLERRPKVVPIDVGRQLFVDDFLVETSDLEREFHYPTRYQGNPILKPETPTELGQFAEKEANGNTKPTAAMISDGFCYDSHDRVFKLWYQAGWRDGTNLAISSDGLAWTRPETDIEPGNNRVRPRALGPHRHGTGISFDPFTADASERYKMLLYYGKTTSAFTSPDGVHWLLRGDLPECGDNATAFYNPFRKKWVISIRVQRKARNGRARNYREHADFLQAIHWTSLPDRASEIAASGSEEYEWAGTDPLDPPDPEMLAKIPPEARDKPAVRALYGDPPQLYNLDAVAYESLMIGMFGILRGPTAGKVWDQLKIVKRNDLHVAYSRDGFYWDRPDRKPFIACTRKPGDWEAGYLHSGVGVLSVVNDKLYFYYSGWSGIGPKGPTTYAGGSTGVAMLRRDGFVSLNAGSSAGTVTTRPIIFKGKHLFVNVDVPQGDLRAEVLDEQGKAIAPFDKQHSIALCADTTRQRLTWKGADDLGSLAGKTVRFRFTLRSGKLYAFWVSPDLSGASYGYIGAGGPGFDGLIDTVGSSANH